MQEPTANYTKASAIYSPASSITSHAQDCKKKKKKNCYGLILFASRLLGHWITDLKIHTTLKNDYEVALQLGPNWQTKADASSPREAGPCAVSDCFFFR